MRNKTFLPGFLFDFPHAKRFKGGGAPTVQPPAYNPPGNTPAAADDSALQSYLATSNPGYYDEFTRNRDRPGSGDTRTFGTWLRDHLNATPGDDLWKDPAISTYAKGGAFVAPTPDDTGTGGTNDAPVPPAPDAPVKASDGTLLTAPTATAPIPPVSDRSSEVQQAGREARRSAKKRRGMLSTFLAGETGGASNPVKTLLGQ